MGKGPEFFKVSESMMLAPDKPPPAMEPLAPTSGIGGAPLLKGGSFLNHAWPRRTNVWRKATSPVRRAKRLIGNPRDPASSA